MKFQLGGAHAQGPRTRKVIRPKFDLSPETVFTNLGYVARDTRGPIPKISLYTSGYYQREKRALKVNIAYFL